MPRSRRWEFPGEIHHVMARGLEGRDIFGGVGGADNGDRAAFLTLLEKNLQRYNVGCLAFALMSNHYHLLLRPRDKKLGECLRALNGSYAQYFNRTRGRRGYLFQDRYQSVVSTGPVHTRETLLYIHLNPLRAGLVRDIAQLASYQWCSHRIPLEANPPGWFERDEALAVFSHSIAHYRRELQSRVGHDLGEEPRELLLRLSSATGGEREGLSSMAAQSSRLAQRRRVLTEQADALRVRQAQLRRKGATIEMVVDRVGKHFGLPGESITRHGRSSGKTVVGARSLVCYWAHRELGMSMVAIGELFGITNGAVSRLVRRGEELAGAEGLSFEF